MSAAPSTFTPIPTREEQIEAIMAQLRVYPECALLTNLI